LLSDQNADLQFPRVSPDGSKLMYQARKADHSIELRVTEIGSNSTETICKTDPGLPVTLLLTAEWSPDGGAIVFDSKTSDNSRIFLMNANGGDVHALTNGELPDFCPSFSSDGKEIFFARDFYGKPKLYRMNLDGSDARPFNSKAGYEQSQVMSPDGKVMLYSADRLDGRTMGLDIYATDPLHPDDEHLLMSRPMHDASAAFSPDGKRIVFTAQSDDNSEIYVANSDGTGLFRLTRNKANDSAPTFLADDRRIIFSSDRGGKFAIYEIDLSF
jgi:TolB protein